MKTPKPFNPDAKCSKCGGEDITTSFHAATDCSFTTCDQCHKPNCKGSHEEHHQRHCRRCHYEWIEGVLDGS